MTDRLVAGAVYLAAFVMLLVGVGSALLAILFFFILTFTMDPSSGSATAWWIGMVASCALAVAPFVVCAVMAVRYARRRRAQAAVPVAVSGMLLGLFAVPAARMGVFESQSSGPLWLILAAAAAIVLTLGAIVPAVYWRWDTPPRPLSPALR